VKIWKAQNWWKLIVIMDLMKILMMMIMNFRLFKNVILGIVRYCYICMN
jgi:hypothetical protein